MTSIEAVPRQSQRRARPRQHGLWEPWEGLAVDEILDILSECPVVMAWNLCPTSEKAAIALPLALLPWQKIMTKDLVTRSSVRI